MLNYTGLTVCDIGSEGALLNSIFMYMDDESMDDESMDDESMDDG
ncbi:hypothetical protein ACJJI4_13455 [Microbulbifer sp. TRSA002]